VRVLHLADRCTDRGGAYVHLLGLIAAERQRGLDVRLAVGRDEGHGAAPCPLEVVAGLEARTWSNCDPEPLVRRFRPDIIHLHTIVNPAVLAWAARHPALITVQDHRYFCPTRGKWRRDGGVCGEPLGPRLCAACFEDEGYFADIYGLTDARLRALHGLEIVVLSAYMRAELSAAGIDAGRVHVVRPFVHGLAHDAAADGAPCVLFVGRLSESKGVADAVEAWRVAALPLPLVFAGTGPLREKLERRGFEVLGWLDRARLSAAYRRARVVLMPSRWQEPFGIAGLEALTFGVPVAAWRSGGIPEWHPGAGLVDWGDVGGLARAARSLAYARAEPPQGFEREAAMLKLGAVYERVAGRA
jgi:glycosyltransferase involved in cell wall biosynthesis